MIKYLTFFLLLLLLAIKPVQAVNDPLAHPNNPFGIHITSEADLDDAAKLVNSSGGQWGYVTLVIPQNDLDQKKWQSIFDRLRQLKLIPLVRLATRPAGDYWSKPQVKDADQWVDFLSSLNWVVKNRYIILFNEPNHAQEWGNDINPTEYTEIVKQFVQKLKASSPDYFILPAGMDTEAPNSPSTMKATDYWQQMHLVDNQIFTLFDGWNSHSYPNKDFTGSAYDQGFGSIRSYLSEINYLRSFNLPQDLPIFITETGWKNQIGVTQKYQTAYSSAWNNPQIVAITPFVLDYTYPPFDRFSFKDPDTQTYHPHYYDIQSFKKNSGQPEQIQSSQLTWFNLPSQLIVDQPYQFSFTFKNTGQAIWDPESTQIKITGNFPPEAVSVTSIENEVKPFQTTTLNLSINTPKLPASNILGLQLQVDGQVLGDKIERVINIEPPTNLWAKLRIWIALHCRSCSWAL